MKDLLTAFLLLSILSSFAQSEYKQVNLKTNLNIPTTRIDSVTLITNNFLKDSAEALALIHAKVILPLAMQQHSAALFDSCLSIEFLYQGEGTLLNRQEYIHDRINGKWTITDVQYENVVLQFYDNMGVLTYGNVVKETDEFGKPQTYFWFWADVWIKEKGRWKLKELRAIN